ncbi:tetratricopeptide repeat protein [Streptomyces sp. NPDC050548]|uniref:tetratricopeptide repeat protein n=1 Tax=Streptomyces sp. NPDC050548 TaxID=3365629 RepID=UPI0037BD5B8F
MSDGSRRWELTPSAGGRIDGGPVVADEGRLACVAVGFPRSEVRDGIPDTKEIRGHIERLTGLKSSGLITAYVDQVAVPGVWAGASGAALFARGRLIGVVTEDHPSTLVSRSNRAGAYRVSGDVARAILLYEQALARCLRVLGENHPTTKTVRANLSAARAQQP